MYPSAVYNALLSLESYAFKRSGDLFVDIISNAFLYNQNASIIISGYGKINIK